MRCVITGGASGIGAATARLLKKRGGKITCIDIADPGTDADEWIKADLDDRNSTNSIAINGHFDALINAAGLPPRQGMESRILNVNFLALRELTEKLITAISPGGSIVNLASKAGARWQENLDQVRSLTALEGPERLPEFVASQNIDPVRAYDLSKEALIAWTKSQTARLKTLGLRANTISPAAVRTPVLDDFMRAFGARAEKGVGIMGRPGTADEVAQVVAFLASPESNWIMGQDIAVDGGLAAIMQARSLNLPGGNSA